MSYKSGPLGRIKALLDRNRLGELLVQRGSLTPLELKTALARQGEEKIPLGKLLVRSGTVRQRDVVSAIATQWLVRSTATLLTVIIAVSALNVRSASARDSVPRAAFATAAAFGPMTAYPDLFGSNEKRSGDLSAFTKWNAMFSRFEGQVGQDGSSRVLTEWKQDLESMRGLPLERMVERVNNLANKAPYINDSKNWGKSDYWETPVEFFTRGGDCEDFAIAKYASLRALGVPDNRMRIAIVKDTQKNIPHAILIVYTNSGPVLLDNQIKTVTRSIDVAHYKPIFSINRASWWLHTPSRGTVMASR